MSSGQLAGLKERVRLAEEHELTRAIDLVRFLSDSVLAMGARHRVTEATVGGVTAIKLDQLSGYYLTPVQRPQQQPGGGDDAWYFVNAWRCDHVVRSPIEDGEADYAAGRIEMLPCHRADTIEAMAAWVMADIQRQWIAEALDDYQIDEYSRPRIIA